VGGPGGPGGGGAGGAGAGGNGPGTIVDATYVSTPLRARVIEVGMGQHLIGDGPALSLTGLSSVPHE
jgi:hypothetical protein